MGLCVSFQFQTGSIKSMSIFMNFIGYYAIMFQFQTGSIKRNTPFAGVDFTLEFQFQTGSIKSIQTNTYIVQIL